MKQTVEEAAKKYSNDCRNRQRHCEPYCIVDFIQGAEWQSKQSPWISVKERLPEPNKLVLCRMVSNGAIVSGYIVVSPGRSPYVATDGGFEFEDWNDYECDMWMPIPSFDEILEANKDVLERIKEKGDINMEVKNGIIIDGVLHEMIDAFTINFDCSKCSLRKECNECKMEHETYLCNVMGCFCFVNRGKVTEIKMEEEKK